MINDDSENEDTVVEVVCALKGIAPVYYSYGNHEYAYMEAGHTNLQEEFDGCDLKKSCVFCMAFFFWFCYNR